MPSSRPAALASRYKALPPSRRFKRILLVDDDLTILRLLTAILSEAGFEVVACAGSVAALEAFQRSHHFDLLLTDLQMPTMDGIALAKLLTGAARRLRVLIISGAAAEDVPLSELWRRNWCFLAKPTSVLLLLKTVDQLCGLLPIHMAELSVMPGASSTSRV